MLNFSQEWEMNGIRYGTHKFAVAILLSLALHNDWTEITSVFVPADDLRGNTTLVNEPNFYFSRHFLMPSSPPRTPLTLPPPHPSRLVCLITQPKGDGLAALGLLVALLRACCYCLYIRRIRECARVRVPRRRAHARNPAFAPVGQRMLPYRAVIIIWTGGDQSAARIWCSTVLASWANRATMLFPVGPPSTLPKVIDH